MRVKCKSDGDEFRIITINDRWKATKMSLSRSRRYRDILEITLRVFGFNFENTISETEEQTDVEFLSPQLPGHDYKPQRNAQSFYRVSLRLQRRWVKVGKKIPLKTQEKFQKGLHTRKYYKYPSLPGTACFTRKNKRGGIFNLISGWGDTPTYSIVYKQWLGKKGCSHTPLCP